MAMLMQAVKVNALVSLLARVVPLTNQPQREKPATATYWVMESAKPFW